MKVRVKETVSARKFVKGVLLRHRTQHKGPGGLLWISSDGDDRRIFLGLKFSIPGFFLGRKILQVFFWVALFKYGFFWVFKTI